MQSSRREALRLEFDDRDEVIVEVAAPEDFDAEQFARPASWRRLR